MIHAPRSLNGACVAPHHLAAQTGRDVLKDGGNALEAMVAAAAIAVVYPHMYRHVAGRWGANENLYGHDEITAFRKARPAKGLARHLTRTVITTFGDAWATAWTEFSRPESASIGRQSQVWVRRPEGWRIVAAHVSNLA